MSLALSLMLGLGAPPPKTYVEDVFSAYTYTGNASTTSHVVGFQPDLVWGKSRANALGHYLADSARGRDKYLYTELTNAQATGSTAGNDLASFDATGFTLGPNQSTALNSNNQTKVAWCFRKAPKFFDVVTYTGNGVSGRSISHALGIAPGMYVVKRTDNTGSWCVWHRSIGTNGLLVLNGTQASSTASTYVQTADASTFTIGNDAEVNGNGNSYVAYLFAHDTGTDGLIQCGSFTTDGSGNASVTLGWEPQFIEIKRADSTGNWQVRDSARGMCAASTGQGSHQLLLENDSGAETASGTSDPIVPTSTGFKSVSNFTSATFVYRAIRAPMKVPTDATKVFKTILNSASGATKVVTGAGFAPDVMLGLGRTSAQYGVVAGRLRGHQFTATYATTAEQTTNPVTSSWDMDGVTLTSDPGGWNINSGGGTTAALQLFKRAPGFMQEVCYTGTGSAKTEAHGLGVAPELWISKSRSATNRWVIGCSYLPTPASDFLELSTSTKGNDTTTWNNTVPTASVFSVGTGTDANSSGVTYDMLLFATCPGVSKVGGYIGTGTTLQINCGFAAGARFALIKRTDSTGDWYVWDSVRGIVSGNDPYLLLNSTAAETTGTDYIDPYSAGFEISSSAPAAINASGGTFIFLAIA